jgi:ATP-binding cassette subfamily B protein/subfamily B ATP-binding cassette protein MsbA
MKNFLRSLRFCWPYRGRLTVSVICALLAAVLWGLNFTAIYPVLKILGQDKNLQDWAQEQIDEVQGRIDGGTVTGPNGEVKVVPGLQRRADLLVQEDRELETKEDTDKVKRRLEIARELSKVESQLDAARTELWRNQLAKKYIDRCFPSDRFETLAWVIGLVVLAVGIKGIFEFGQESLVGSVVNLSLLDLRNRFYRNALHLDMGSYGDHGSSELIARFTNDMEMLGNGQKTLFGKIVAEPLRALSCILIASWISWRLTLMFLVLVPIAAFILTRVGRIMKRATRRLLERMSNIYKILQETFQGIRVVKAFTTEPYERRRFSAATRDYYKKAMLVVNLDAAASPVIELLGVAAVAGALLAGAYLVLSKKLELFGLPMTSQPLEAASLLQLYALLAAIADPVRKLSSVFTRLQSGAAAADRIFGMADRLPRVRGNSDGQRLQRHHHSIEFRDVCFSYDPHRPILTNLNFRVGFGETIAVVGKNGSGKTTLVGLLPRFYDPDHGSVLIDGLDLRQVRLRSLRRQVGLVTQHSYLFADTIYKNIIYGKRHASREEAEAAARLADVHDAIMRQPKGYDTRLGEAGEKLSGGERQKLALARVILRNPSILILDEFTSQADVESEALIHRTLKEFMAERTTFVITHRLNTLEMADRIIVLDNGRLAAFGTHAELLATCAVYQRLHEAQFRRHVA